MPSMIFSIDSNSIIIQLYKQGLILTNNNRNQSENIK